MKTLTIRIKEGTSYINAYLEILNGLLKLSDKELKVLETFLAVNTKEPCSPEVKAIVVQKCEMKNVAVLNNYIKKFKDKGIMNVNKFGIYSYNPILDPENFRNGLAFKFVDA